MNNTVYRKNLSLDSKEVLCSSKRKISSTCIEYLHSTARDQNAFKLKCGCFWVTHSSYEPQYHFWQFREPFRAVTTESQWNGTSSLKFCLPYVFLLLIAHLPSSDLVYLCKICSMHPFSWGLEYISLSLLWFSFFLRVFKKSSLGN